MRRTAILLATSTALALAGVAAQPLAPPQPLQVNVFPGGSNWPIWVAAERGFFAANGVAVKITSTPNSVEQLTGLIAGKFDVAMTAVDNLVAYREGQGEAKVEGPDLFAFMGGNNGFLSLVTLPDIKRFDDLRGRTLSVDALTTGFAFVLLEMLERNGLALGRDYQLQSAGGTLQRFDALIQGKHAGTLLSTPFDVQAQARGYVRLAGATEVLGRYQGTLGGARKAWAEHNRDALVGYIRGYVSGVRWLYDPKNREEALAIFVKNQPNATPQAASSAYSVLLDPTNGIARDAAIELDGLRTALALRSKYGVPQKALADPMKYYDPTYYDAALRP